MKINFKLWVSLATGIALLSLVTGCVSMGKAGEAARKGMSGSLYTPRNYADEEFGRQLRTLQDKGEATLDAPAGRQFVYDQIGVIGRDYQHYVDLLTSGRATLNILYDSTSLGLTGAAAIVSPAGTKSILAAIATFFGGQQKSVDKNLFDEKAIFVLTATTQVRRTKVLEKLRQSLKDYKSNGYSFDEALIDVSELYQAGSLQTALQATFVTQVATTETGTPPSPAPAGNEPPARAPFAPSTSPF
jgi:hypothetical protein